MSTYQVNPKAINLKLEDIELNSDNKAMLVGYTSDNEKDEIATLLIEKDSNSYNVNVWYDINIDAIDADVKFKDELGYISRNGRNIPLSKTTTVDSYLRIFQSQTRRILKQLEKQQPMEKDTIEVECQVEAEQPETSQEEQARREAKNKLTRKREKSISLEGQIANIVYDCIEDETSLAMLESQIQTKLDAWGIIPNKTEVVVLEADKAPKNVGQQHKQFKEVFMAIKAGVNVALVGPAGSGKTTCVKEVSKALDLEFYSKSVSAQTGTHEFFGYQDANGNYVRTIFRDAFEYGGVFLLDEFDAGNPNVLAALNQATANGECAFADGMVEKHEDFIVVMAGNTFGHGANSEYVGRNRIDAATLDRFVFINFGYDEEFELQLATNKDWCKLVQKIRKVVGEKRIKTIISPRASFDGSKLLSVGMEQDMVLKLTIFKGLTEEEVKMIQSEI